MLCSKSKLKQLRNSVIRNVKIFYEQTKDLSGFDYRGWFCADRNEQSKDYYEILSSTRVGIRN